MNMREEHPLKAPAAIDVTPCAIVTSVISSLPEKFSIPEYTAASGILGRMKVVL
jgi:hypothetical protein